MDSNIECFEEVDDADKQLVKSVKPLLCEIRGAFSESSLRKKVIHSLLDRPEFVKLPAYLEWADDLFFSWLVDTVCEKLNVMTGHNFMGLKLKAEQEQELVKEL